MLGTGLRRTGKQLIGRTEFRSGKSLLHASQWVANNNTVKAQVPGLDFGSGAAQSSVFTSIFCSAKQNRLVRAFSQAAEVMQTSPANNSAQKMIKYNRSEEKINSARDTSEYWSIFGFNLMNKESEIGMLQVVLAEIPAHLRQAIIDRLSIIYNICTIYPSMQSMYLSKDLTGLIGKSTPEQKEQFIQQYTSFCGLMQQAIQHLSPLMCLDLIRYFQANKFYSHDLTVGLYNKMYAGRAEGDKNFTDQDFYRSVELLHGILKRYVLPGVSPEQWALCRAWMGDLMNYNTMSFLLDKTILFCQNHKEKLNIYFVSDVVGALEFMSGALPVTNPKKFFIIRVVSAWLYQESSKFANYTSGENTKLLEVITCITRMGGTNPLLRKVTLELEATMLKKCRSARESFKTALNFISVYTDQGFAEKEHFESRLKPVILPFLNEQRLKVIITDVTLLINYLTLFSWRDTEYSQALVDLLNSMCPDFESYQSQRDHKRYGLHRALNYLLLKRYFTLRQAHQLARVSNYLNAECICLNADRKLTEEPNLDEWSRPFMLYPEIADSPAVLWCTSHTPSAELVLSHNFTAQPPLDFTQDNYTEILTKRALLEGVKANLVEEMLVFDDRKDIAVCMYKWDFVIRIQGVEKPIGFEVSGHSYRDQERRLATKKKLKIDYLSLVGYIPLVFDMSAKGLKTLYTEGKPVPIGCYLLMLVMVKVAQLSGKVLQTKPGKFDFMRNTILSENELLDSKERAILLSATTENEFAAYLQKLADEGSAKRAL